MKKKFRNKQGKANLSLSMVMNANWEDDKLMAKIEKFRAYRRKEYERLVKEQQKLRKLEVNINGRKKTVDVMSMEVR